MVSTCAIIVEDVDKSYGNRSAKVNVLKGLNLNVPQGIIYSLLGCSGCGKTTLLKCLVGRLKVDKGQILAFGQAPGSKNINIPGSSVGYMPQELALYKELTIHEILAFVGCVHGMRKKDVKFRIAFILQLLQLSNKDKLIGNLSGGQQRLVSFAMALIHHPPLLILDEPTVGVDPVLRESIWNHLLEISTKTNTTIIITTHYTQEAAQANKVGLMRNGKILAEDEPKLLMTHHHLPTLEAVYLNLCHKDEEITEIQKNKKHSSMKDSLIQIETPEVVNPTSTTEYAEKLSPTYKFKLPISTLALSRISALLNRNFIRLKRRLLLTLFVIVNPAIVISVFCSAIGSDPKEVHIAVANEDQNFGNQYLEFLYNSSICQIPVASLEAGIDLVKQGKADGVIDIWQNFTFALKERFRLSGKKLPQNVLQAGSIRVMVDGTDPVTLLYIQKQLLNSLDKLDIYNLQDGNNPELSGSLIHNDDPIYVTSSVTEFMVPGLAVNIVFIIAVGFIAVEVLKEKANGTLDRTYALGVSSAEIMWGIIIPNMVIIIVEVAIAQIVLHYYFLIPCNGSIILANILIILQGFCGLSFGWFISNITESESSALMLTMGTTFPLFYLSGTLWPLKATPEFIQVISNFNPQKFAVEALRWIMFRGRGMLWKPVWLGFISTAAWICLFLCLSLVVMRLKR